MMLKGVGGDAQTVRVPS